MTAPGKSYLAGRQHVLLYDDRDDSGRLPKLTIGEFCSIADNITFIFSQHPTHLVTTYPSHPESIWSHNQGSTGSFSRGDIIVEHDVWIGANVTILDNVTIRTGAVVGAGSVVTKDVPPYAIVGGNPAKVIKYRFDTETIDLLLQSNWWTLPYEELKAMGLYTSDIKAFCKNVQGHFATRTAMS